MPQKDCGIPFGPHEKLAVLSRRLIASPETKDSIAAAWRSTPEKGRVRFGSKAEMDAAGVCWKQHTDPLHAPVLLRSHCERQHSRRAG
ncbi:MAG: hypothetical protein WCF56_08340 [Pseudolabrys sp.]